MVRILFGSILMISLGSVAIAEKPPIVEFRRDVLEHRKRVVEHSLLIFSGHPKLFHALNSLPPEKAIRIIKTYMSLHDAPKTMTRFELEKLGYKGSASLLKLLHGIWGENVNPKPLFIEELNTLEDALKKEKMAIELADIDPALHQEIMAELEVIERAADVTDTKIFRGKELGFIRRAFSAEKFLFKNGEVLAAFLSRWLEATHHPMVYGLAEKRIFKFILSTDT